MKKSKDNMQHVESQHTQGDQDEVASVCYIEYVLALGKEVNVESENEEIDIHEASYADDYKRLEDEHVEDCM